jgi:quercetin dioxygenase-like cupin family protein
MAALHHWADVPEGRAAPAVVKRKIEGLCVDLVRIEIKAGEKADRHAHPHEQFVQVIAGRGTLETAEGRQAFAAGSVFHFPAATWHSAEFDEDTILVETNLKTL